MYLIPVQKVAADLVPPASQERDQDRSPVLLFDQHRIATTAVAIIVTTEEVVPHAVVRPVTGIENNEIAIEKMITVLTTEIRGENVNVP